ncbi:hypothetical protein BP5796_09861 [Coleophoma crateriformis]|uniref:Glucose-methanol-choline oxidoreductase N-terminal domain-containing protein n=1 Tax=Coleophoma crateriformis TaxID=565419 RepID=A0A3D8QTQ1_9HELO|nr:hypothetical protein BP5796_09861 [Coleophoma crateriformis]
MLPSFTIAAVALPAIVFAFPTANIARRSATNDATLVADQTFDYVIAGGGLSGLTVASRLSEDPNIKVLVIEGGQNDSENPMVYDVRNYGQAIGTALDYNLTTSPISWRNNDSLAMVAARTLGGSTSINGATWTKGEKGQYDLLSYLTGDATWGWDSLSQEMLLAEHFNPPLDNLTDSGAQYIASAHGFNGSVQVAFPNGMYENFGPLTLNSSLQVWSGLDINADVSSGHVNGATTVPFALQPDVSQNRSSSYTAWIRGEPETRSNLVILLGHRVVKINWATSNPISGNLVASGVQFQASRDAPVMTVKASREVLLAAGSLQSPQLLELSGVGKADVLAAAGIPLVKSASSVGQNLQEQTKTQFYFTPKSLNFGGTGPSGTIAYPNVWQVLGENASAIYEETIAGLPAYAAELEKAGYIVNATAAAEIMTQQVNGLWNSSQAATEIHFSVSIADKNVGGQIWDLIVLSRGSVHVQTNNSWDQPSIKPNYFAHPLDKKLQVMTTRQVREVYNTEPLASFITAETTPGFSVVPKNATYQEWEKWVEDNFTSVWHNIATLSCMKEELGGAVDNRLKVYGIDNVRAIDASVLPVQLSAHLSSSLYGIALKAANMIKQDQ